MSDMACNKCGNERVLGCPNCEQYDFSDKNAEIMSLLARAEAAEKRAEQADREQHETRELLAKVNWIGFREKAYRELRIEDGLAFDCAAAALSRCTPPASKEATNG